MKALYSILLIAAFVFTALAGVVIGKKPTAYPTDGGSVAVQWMTLDETGVRGFDVLRSQIIQGNVTNFVSVTGGQVIGAKGNNSSYDFVDRSVFKTTENIFVYKVRVYFNDGSYSDSEISERTTNMTASAAKRTWGSIKAMFR